MTDVRKRDRDGLLAGYNVIRAQSLNDGALLLSVNLI